MTRSSRAGWGLLETMLAVAALGILLKTGKFVLGRGLGAGQQLIFSEQALAAAEHVMEYRRLTGRFPEGAQAPRSPGLTMATAEEPFAGTDLIQVTVRVGWRGTGARKPEVKLVSLMGKGS